MYLVYIATQNDYIDTYYTLCIHNDIHDSASILLAGNNNNLSIYLYIAKKLSVCLSTFHVIFSPVAACIGAIFLFTTCFFCLLGVVVLGVCYLVRHNSPNLNNNSQGEPTAT